MIERIKARMSTMTPGQLKVATYICSHMETVSFQTISQIAQEVGVSETTVMRLSYALDFSGFSEMQKVIRQEVLGNLDNSYEQEDGHTDNQDKYLELLDKDIEILQTTKRQLDTSKIGEAVELIVKADRVFSIGFRTSAVSAMWFASTVSVLRPNVVELISNSFSYTSVLDATKNSVAVVISFSRYARETIFWAEHIKQSGGKIIAITDNAISPVARIAEVTLLTTPNKIAVGANSQASAISLLNLLLTGVADQIPDFHTRIRKLEELYGESNSILE